MAIDSLLYKNPDRVVLTELMPYEAILGFDTVHFFTNIKSPELRKMIKDGTYLSIDRQERFKIPFDYHVRRSGGEKSRKLSLMHPASQLSWVDFYKEFETFMLYYTSLSPISVRYPYRITKTAFVTAEGDYDVFDDSDEADIELDDDITSVRELNYKNYFTYRKYGLITKFFDSFEFLNLEKKFSYMRHLDIASCFYHIYTHSICWAVKDKSTAKLIHGESNIFENKFDKLMSDSNYGETNGILVGPEISRIFAETIFQRVDLILLEKLNSANPELQIGKDFDIKRYVDDYYIFTNSVQLTETIQSFLCDIIEDYKLYLNKAKIENFSRPMVIPSQMAKADVKESFNQIFNEWIQQEYYPCDVNKNIFEIINKIRLCIRRNNAEYSDISAYGLTFIKNFITNNLKHYFVGHPEKANKNIFLILIEVAFYLFSMDWCPSTSYKICQIIGKINNICNQDILLWSSIRHKIITEAKRSLDIMTMNEMDGCSNIESMNLLLTLKIVCKHSFSETFLRKIFNDKIGNRERHLDYFQICSLLFLCGNDPEYSNMAEDIKKSIKYKLSGITNKGIEQNAELTYLILDLMTCPFLDNSFKNIILINSGLNSEKAGKKRAQISKPGKWFFDWNFSSDFKSYLKKKEFKPSYD